MNALNLCTYFQEGLFFNALAEQKAIDAIIIDKPLPKSWSPTLPVYSLQDMQRWAAWALQALVAKHKHVLLLWDKLPSRYLIPLLHTAPQELSITLLNIGAGVSWISSKGMSDLTDIDHVLPTRFRIVEPCDVLSFFVLLKQPGHTYVRLPNKEFVADLLQGEGTPTRDNGLLDARLRWYRGEQATIICPGGLLSGVIQALHTLNTEEIAADLFVLSDYRFKRSKALIESCKTTEHCIVLLDQHAQSVYKDILQLTSAQKIGGNIVLDFLLPTRETPTALPNDDLRHQAGFSPEMCYERLRELMSE
jgi:hypothetical protein